MTENEAIKILNGIEEVRGKLPEDGEEVEIALDMAIKALEQKAVLDKIKAEIDQKQYYFMDDKDYDEGIRFGLMLAYQTVDKYKAESEEEKW